MKKKKNDYDAIIIGAGIGGLVCGCYLAKAGMKVLIVEKNAKPGGYCTSFTRNGFTFDACVHSLGSLGEGQIISKIMAELDIRDRINIRRFDPTDIIYSPSNKIIFWNKERKTIKCFQENFPLEKEAIVNFFKFIKEGEKNAHVFLRKVSFLKLLDKYFHQKEIKSIFSFLVLVNIGVPASRISAFTAVKFYKQFMLDGGYYPDDRMQSFSSLLSKRFEELGGEIIFSHLVEKVEVKNGSVRGVFLSDKKFKTSKYVVSNCDGVQTFFKLLDKNVIEKKLVKKIKKMKPSLSACVLYMGINEFLNILPSPGTNAWHLLNYNTEKICKEIEIGNFDNIYWFMLRVMPNKKSILVFINAPFLNEDFWFNNKTIVLNKLIKEIEKFYPDLLKHIVFKSFATPVVMKRWTLNYNGAAYGWESSVDQFALPELHRKTGILNLFLTGHWTGLAQGVPGVAYLGYNTARVICNKEHK